MRTLVVAGVMLSWVAAVSACGEERAAPDTGKDSGVRHDEFIRYCEGQLPDPGKDACLKCVEADCCDFGSAGACLATTTAGGRGCFGDSVGCVQDCLARAKPVGDAGVTSSYGRVVACVNSSCLPSGEGVFPEASSGAGAALVQCIIGVRGTIEDMGDSGATVEPIAPSPCASACFPGWQD